MKNKYITTFADYEVDNNSGEAIGYESAVEMKEPEYPVSEDDASHFEDAMDEVDYDALRDARRKEEEDDAWNNLRDELHPERATITTAIANCEEQFGSVDMSCCKNKMKICPDDYSCCQAKKSTFNVN